MEYCSILEKETLWCCCCCRFALSVCVYACVIWEMVWTSFREFYCQLLCSVCVRFPESLPRHLDYTTMLGLIMWAFFDWLEKPCEEAKGISIYSSLMNVPFWVGAWQQKETFYLRRHTLRSNLCLCTPGVLRKGFVLLFNVIGNLCSCGLVKMRFLGFDLFSCAGCFVSVFFSLLGMDIQWFLFFFNWFLMILCRKRRLAQLDEIIYCCDSVLYRFLFWCSYC